jgi:hypothetical protein
MPRRCWHERVYRRSCLKRIRSLGEYLLQVQGQVRIERHRYHIGESLLPSMREFLQFIDAYDKFEAHGFRHKVNLQYKQTASKLSFLTDSRTELHSATTASLRHVSLS